MRSPVVALLLCLLTTSPTPADSLPKGSSETMLLTLRTRVKPYQASEAWTEGTVEQVFPTAKVAMIITDMWDKHWCDGATARVGQIAHRMEPLLQKARASGILIIHAPSDTMSSYEGTAGRKLAEDAPHVPRPPRLHCTIRPCRSTTAMADATRAISSTVPGVGRHPR